MNTPACRTTISITPKIVADDVQLAAAVDEVLRTDPELQRLQAKVVEAQARLRAILGDDAWLVYLRVDEVVGERHSEAVLVIARWAFTEGVKNGGQRP